MALDTQQILAFLAVADTGSFSAAAHRLNLSQPAISKRVASLENQLGRPLFDRIGRQVQLTEAGEALLPVARQLRHDLEDARRAVEELGGPVSGRLKLVTSHHIGLHHLPEILRDYVRHYPAVKLDLAFMDSEDAFLAVERGEYELAIVTLPERIPDALTVRTLWVDAMPITVARSHPLASVGKVEPAMLEQYRAILPARHTVTRQRVDSWLHDLSARTGEVMEVNYLETIRTLVSIGLGWSALPRTLHNDDLLILDFGRPPPQRLLGLARHRSRSATRAGRVLENWLSTS